MVSLAMGTVTAPEAWAATLYVATTGSDGGPNTCLVSGSPCKTITHALTQAASLDDIQVAAGTYDTGNGETLPLGMLDGVAIIGDTTDPTTRTISAPIASLVFDTSIALGATSRLAGFTLKHDAVGATHVMRFDVGAFTQAPQIDHNRFVATDNSGDGIEVVDSSGSSGAFTATIENNTFSGLDEGVKVSISSGGSGDDFSPTIRGNTFSGNDQGVMYEIASPAEGSASPSIESNVFTGQTFDDIDLLCDSFGGGDFTLAPTISGNTFTGTGADGVFISVGPISLNASSDVATISPTITNNTFTGAGFSAISISLTDLSTGIYSADMTISGNTITSPGSDGIFIKVTSFSGGDGFDAKWTITNNTITSPTDDGIDIVAGSLSGGWTGAFDLTVAGNTIDGAADDGIFIDISSWSPSAIDQSILIQGNTVTGSTDKGIRLSVAGQESLTANDIAITDNFIDGSGGDGLYVASNDYFANAITVSCNIITNSTGNGILQASQNDPPADFGGGNLASPGNNVLMGNGDGSTTFDFRNDDDADVKAESNWWGTAVLATIATQVYDDADDATKGVVDYDPPLASAPVTTMTAELVDSVLVDNPPAGPSLTDTILYTATVTEGAGDDCGNSGVVFTAPIPANAAVAPGSVTTTKGNIADEDPVTVAIGTMAPAEVVTITWQVIPSSGVSMSTQGTATAGKTGNTPSDDPDTGPPADPTVTVFPQQQGEAIPTLGQWGLVLFGVLLLLLGVAAVRRRAGLALGLALALFSGGWLFAGEAKSKDGKRSTSVKATRVAAVEQAGGKLKLVLDDGSSLTVSGHELHVKDRRFNPPRPSGHTKLELQAFRAEREVQLYRHRDEVRTARQDPISLLRPGIPLVVKVKRDGDGRLRKVEVEVYAGEQQARAEVARTLARREQKQRAQAER